MISKLMSVVDFLDAFCGDDFPCQVGIYVDGVHGCMSLICKGSAKSLMRAPYFERLKVVKLMNVSDGELRLYCKE